MAWCTLACALGALCLATGCGPSREYVYVAKQESLRSRENLLADSLRSEILARRRANVNPPNVNPTDSIPTDSIATDSIPTDSVAKPSMTPDDVRQQGVRMGVRTNLLMDAAAIPNLAVEFALGKGFSIEGEWMYAWWRQNSRYRFWRIYGGNLTARYYFGETFKGHHVGLYGGAFTFCFEWGGTGYMGGLPGHGLWDRCMVNAGVEYGYSIALGRRFNMDFSLGVGYIGGIIEKYTPKQGEYLRLSTSRHHWWGPTRAGVSLVWLIGPDNYNTRKGGER